jgi:hypothetical protein
MKRNLDWWEENKKEEKYVKIMESQTEKYRKGRPKKKTRITTWDTEWKKK